MAKPILPVDFKDDIMSTAMDGKRRYRMITNSDETVSFEDATTYDQIGSDFGAAQVNAMSQATNQSVDANKVVESLSDIGVLTNSGYVPDALAVKELKNNLTADSTPFRFGKDADGNYGYILPDGEGGADTVHPFSSDIKEIAYICYNADQSSLGTTIISIKSGNISTNYSGHGTSQDGKYLRIASTGGTNGKITALKGCNCLVRKYQTDTILNNLKTGDTIWSGSVSGYMWTIAVAY